MSAPRLVLVDRVCGHAIPIGDAANLCGLRALIELRMPCQVDLVEDAPVPRSQVLLALAVGELADFGGLQTGSDWQLHARTTH